MRIALALCVFAFGALVHAQERYVDKEVRVKAPVDAVWQAWTTSEGIKSFFAPDARVEARVDGPFEVYINPLAPPGQRGADDMRFLATAVLLQKETGGNLALILDKTAALARERARLYGQLRIYTAQGRITGWILCMAPFIMFALMSFVNWKYERILFTNPIGLKIIYVGLGMMLLGILIIRKIIDIKV